MANQTTTASKSGRVKLDITKEQMKNAKMTVNGDKLVIELENGDTQTINVEGATDLLTDSGEVNPDKLSVTLTDGALYIGSISDTGEISYSMDSTAGTASNEPVSNETVSVDSVSNVEAAPGAEAPLDFAAIDSAINFEVTSWVDGAVNSDPVNEIAGEGNVTGPELNIGPAIILTPEQYIHTIQSAVTVLKPGVFSISDVTVAEDAGTATFTVTRSGGSDGAVSVDYATSDGPALAGPDYAAISGTLNFADGETSKIVAVNITDDTANEANETFTVTLSNPSGGGSLADSSATGTITANDLPAAIALNGIDAGDQSGYSVSGAGDINNDGYDDIIIGASGADINSGAATLNLVDILV